MRDKLVFVSGNFNVLHPGHLRLLAFARECGARLVVGVFSDRMAGAGALVPEMLRLEGVQSNSLVDEAFLIDEPVENVIARIRPGIVVKGKEHDSRCKRLNTQSYGHNQKQCPRKDEGKYFY